MHTLEKLARTKLALEVVDAAGLLRSPLSETLGRASTPLSAVRKGSMAPLGAGASSEQGEMKKVIDSMKDMSELGDVSLNLGGTSPIRDFARIWKNKNTNILGKLYGSAAFPLRTLTTSLFRDDGYNPYSNAATVFTSEPGILRQELSRAVDYKRKDSPMLYSMASGYPLVKAYQDIAAGLGSGDDAAREIARALDTGNKEELSAVIADARRTNRLLGAELGPGIASLGGGLLGGLVGNRVLSSLLNRYGSSLHPMLSAAYRQASPSARARALAGIGAALGATLGVPAGYLGGQVVGSTMAPFIQGESRDIYNQGIKALRQDRTV